MILENVKNNTKNHIWVVIAVSNSYKKITEPDFKEMTQKDFKNGL